MIAPTELRDPVCGMTLEPYDVALSREYGGHTYDFCSPVCRERFDRDPGRYVPTAPALEHARVGGVRLSCAGDAHRLERHLAKVPGITNVTVNPVTEEVYLTFDPNRLSLANVRSAVADECASFG